MNRNAVLSRGKAVREYFREKYAGKVQDANEAKEDILGRFDISATTWGTWWRGELNRLNEVVTSQQEEKPSGLVPQPPEADRPAGNHEPFTLHIPPDLPEGAKAVINTLLSHNEQLQEQAEEQRRLATMHQEMCLAAHRRMGLLKRLSKELIDQL